MTNTLIGQSSICISKYKYSASLIISLLTAIVLTLTTISYINIALFSILILCVSLFYLSRNNVIEGNVDVGDGQALRGLSSSAVNAILSGFDNVLKAHITDINLVNGLATSLANQPALDNQSITDGANNSSTSINNNGPYIDTTIRTKNDKVFDAYYKINLNGSCSAFNNTQCDAEDSCIWVNNICERGDKSGPYPLKNSNGSLVDVDYNYYKIK